MASASSKFGLLSLMALPLLASPLRAETGVPAPVRVEETEFAPGTVRVIPPEVTPQETYTGPLTLTDLLEAHPEIRWSEPDFPGGRPHFDPRTRTLEAMAREVILRREAYCLEFAFKPLRNITIDIPQPSGVMERKLIWYMVYRVRYLGGDLRPRLDPDATAGPGVGARIESVAYESRRFFPLLVLSSKQVGKEYLDRILPAATEKIAVREKITAPLYNTVDITAVPIPRSDDPAAEGIWGVATWEDVDPRIDFASVYVYGLTNAFEREETEEGKVRLVKKALQLNFYRPGDVVREEEDRIRFGVPAYSDPEQQQYYLDQYGLDVRLDYRWIFR